MVSCEKVERGNRESGLQPAHVPVTHLEYGIERWANLVYNIDTRQYMNRGVAKGGYHKKNGGGIFHSVSCAQSAHRMLYGVKVETNGSAT